jgi:hypothetical protein
MTSNTPEASRAVTYWVGWISHDGLDEIDVTGDEHETFEFDASYSTAKERDQRYAELVADSTVSGVYVWQE